MEVCRLKQRRVILIVLDSVGIGALPDAAAYGDAGANTLQHIAQQIPNFRLPRMEQLGLGNIEGVDCLPKVAYAQGAYGRAKECSAGKDTTVGHWEIAGLISPAPLPTYPNGFPRALIAAFEQAIGCATLGNKPASGTAILDELGGVHLQTGYPIVYTSADSVFQIAAHEAVVPLEQLYRYCRIAREILQGEHAVGRVIARPFIGSAGQFTRTANRHDFALPPPGITMLDRIKEAGLACAGVGKIQDIFAGRGITDSVSTKNNMDGIDQTLAMMNKHAAGLIFVNLVDFDMQYGHRRNVQGYAEALQAFDARLAEIYEQMQPEDWLVITADHGCDPTYTGSDHTREYVPLLLYGNGVPANQNLGTRAAFADIAETILDRLGCPPIGTGEKLI